MATMKEKLDQLNGLARADGYIKNLEHHLSVVAAQRAAKASAEEQLPILQAKIAAAAIEADDAGVELAALQAKKEQTPEDVKRVEILSKTVNEASADAHQVKQLESVATSPIGFSMLTLSDLTDVEVETVINALLALRRPQLEQMKSDAGIDE